MIEFLHKIVAFVKAHKIAFSIGGGVVTAASVAALIERKKYAAIGEKLVAKIKTVLGKPYIWGGRSPDVGFDCSGIVAWSLRELGLEHKKWYETATQMYKDSSTVLVPQIGDLTFYGPLFGDVDHVMVYMGDGNVIGSSGGGPKTKTIQDARDRNAFVKILPVHYRSDFRGYGRLPIQEAKEIAVGGLQMLGAK